MNTVKKVAEFHAAQMTTIVNLLGLEIDTGEQEEKTEHDLILEKYPLNP